MRFNDRTQTDELAFLRAFESDQGALYTTADWLKSSFFDDKWECQFEGTRTTITFGVPLEDGSLLTELKHSALLRTVKSFLCVQSHAAATGGRILAAMPAHHKVSRAARLVDYFLLHSAHFRLAEYGFDLVTTSDLRRLLFDLASADRIRDAIYSWTERTGNYLRRESLSISSAELAQAIAEEPSIRFDWSEDFEKTFPLNNEELIRCRAFLWLRGFYRLCTSGDFRYSVAWPRVMKSAFGSTLWGTRIDYPYVAELALHPVERYGREYGAVPVRSGLGPGVNDKSIRLWQQTICSMALVMPQKRKLWSSVSSDDKWTRSLASRELGRFRTVDLEQVFRALRASIEFVDCYGADLVDGYIRLASGAKAARQSLAAYLKQVGAANVIPAKLVSSGVRTWHLAGHLATSEANPARPRSIRASKHEYHRRLRAHEGMYELIRVLFGAIQFAIGALMARRQGELLDLVAGKCLDRSGRYLIFLNRKTGIAGMRQEELRPVPEIAVRMIQLLERLQLGLIANGFSAQMTNLFAPPTRKGTVLGLTCQTFNASLDFFSDYIQAPRDANGDRYYIRQHQLRRFFSMLFFWGRSFGGLDTLRWFLGHADAEHIYHYITESTPGTVLAATKAAYARNALAEGDKAAAALADLVGQHFHTTEFSVLDDDELECYILDLIAEGTVKVEPHFFLTESGKSYRVLIHVRSPHGTL